MRRRLLTFALLLGLVGLVAVLAVGFQHDPNVASSPLITKHAPEFSLRSLEDRRVSLATFRGRPLIVNFWASWCTTCPADHAALLEAWSKQQRYSVSFVGIAYQDSVSGARSFLRAHGGERWPNLQDPGQQTAIDYGVTGVPETFFIDRSGVIRYKSTGPVTPEILHIWLPRLARSRA